MARDSSGTYTLPSGNPIAAGTAPIASSWANTTLTDLGNEITASMARTAARASDGSATTPSFNFGAQTGTGFFRKTTGVGVAASGSEILAITSSGIVFPDGNTLSSTGGVLSASGSFAGLSFPPRNFIRNGGFEYAPRGFGVTAYSSPSVAHTFACWAHKINTGGDTNFWNLSSAAVYPSTANSGSILSRSFFSNPELVTSPTASQRMFLNQFVPAREIQSLYNPTTEVFGQTRLSFWVRSSVTGAFPITLALYAGTTRTGPSAAQYIAEVTIDAADTWEYKTIDIPDSPVVALGADFMACVAFGIGNGPNMGTTARGWTVASAVNSVSVDPSCYLKFADTGVSRGTSGKTLNLTGVVWNTPADSTVYVPDEPCVIAKYIQKVTLLVSGYSAAAGQGIRSILPFQEMWSTPSLEFGSLQNISNINAPTVANGTASGLIMLATTIGTGQAFAFYTNNIVTSELSTFA